MTDSEPIRVRMSPMLSLLFSDDLPDFLKEDAQGLGIKLVETFGDEVIDLASLEEQLDARRA